MSWLKEIIKKLFGEKLKFPKNKVKLLEEKTSECKEEKTSNTKQQQSEFLGRIKEEINPSINTVEGAIEQYLYSLLNRKNTTGNVNSYGALTDISAIQDSKIPGKNLENEKILLNYINNNRDFSITEQKNRKGEVVYYHIYKGQSKQWENRIYLNCERKNVAEMASQIINELQGTESYYFKFDSDYLMSKSERSEKIVFYIYDSKNLNDVVNAIEKAKQKKPKLFEKSNSVNPFLDTYNGYIAYVNEVTSNKYITLSGQEKIIDKSYNSLLAEALNDSYLSSVREVVSRDYELTAKTKGEIYKESSAYTFSVLEDILKNPEMKQQLIYGIKEKLQHCMQRNSDLQIKGLNRNTNFPEIPNTGVDREN